MMRILLLFAILLTSLCSTARGFGEHFNVSAIFDRDFDDFVEQQLANYHVPGLSLAFVDLEHNLRIAKGYGYSNLPSTKATADTLYFTGSTTKAFTGAAAALIVLDSDGYPHVNWDTPMSELLPGDFALDTEYSTRHTTLEDALSHRSGLPRHDFAYGWNNASTTDLIRSLKHLPMSAAPRTRWQYCNLMFAAVGEVIERLVNDSLENVLRKWFWKPFGMKSTFFSLTSVRDHLKSNKNQTLARGYYFVDDDNDRWACSGQWVDNVPDGQSTRDNCYYVPEPYMNISALAGAGATVSSVKDYAQWLESLLRLDGTLNQFYHTILSPRSIMPSILPVSDPNIFILPPLYSLGWMSLKAGPFMVVLHPGGLPGFGTNLFLMPDEGIGFVTMGNTQETAGIVGNFIFGYILKKRFGDLPGITEFSDTVSESLGSSLPREASFGPQPRSISRGATQARSAPKFKTRVPAPREGFDIVGIYSHPAYGTLNVTKFGSSSPSTAASKLAFQQIPLPHMLNDDIEITSWLVTPSARTWNWAMVLNLSFDVYHYLHAELMLPHGPHTPDTVEFPDQKDCGKSKGNNDEDLICKDEVIWGIVDERRTGIEYGLDGFVDRLGLELDDELVRQAFEEGGDQNWRAGMIWFTKLY